MGFPILSSKSLHRTLASVAAVLVAVLGLGLAKPAGAEDGKVFPGSFCRGDEYSDVYRYSGGSNASNPSVGVANVGNQGPWTICPIVRDNMGNRVKFAQIWVSGRASCFFSRANPGATSGYFSSQIYHNNDFAVGGYTMWYPTPSVYNAAYEIRCHNLGGTTRVYSYKVEEY